MKMECVISRGKDARRSRRMIILSTILLLIASSELLAVSYRGIAEDGTRYFVCERSCGRVRVKKIDNQLYRVYSIGYSGNMVANSEKEAAEKACGERDMTGSKRSPAVPDRGGACN